MEFLSRNHGNYPVIANQFTAKFRLQLLFVVLVLIIRLRGNSVLASFPEKRDANSAESAAANSNHGYGNKTGAVNPIGRTVPVSTWISRHVSSAKTEVYRGSTTSSLDNATSGPTHTPTVYRPTSTLSTPEPTTVRGQCGGRYTTKNGKFYSPDFPNNYPPGASCEYNIHANGGHFISVNFSVFDLRGYSCQYDYVEVRDGIGSSGTLVGVFCGGIGREPPEVIVSSTNNVYMLFVSSNLFTDIPYQGFEATYEITPKRPAVTTDSTPSGQCGGYYEGKLKGSFSTPYYPNENYPSNITCMYIISVPEGYSVMLTFTNFELQSKMCKYDYTDVLDGYIPGTHIGRYCGSFEHGTGYPPPSKLITQTNNVTIVFESDDDDVQYAGFFAQFEATTNSMNMTAWDVCDETRMAVTDRGGILMSHPDYGFAPYPNLNKECITRLLGMPGSDNRIYIKFLELDLYPPVDMNRCHTISDDNIQIMEETGVPLATLCGKKTGSYMSSGALMDVTFKTLNREDRENVIGDNDVYMGFKAVYTVFYDAGSSDGLCRNLDFKCDNGWCIAPWLTCDNYEHCSDGSDEFGCSREENGSFVGIIIGLSIAIVFGIISYVLLVAVSKKRGFKCFSIRRENQRRRGSSQNRSTDENWNSEVAMRPMSSLYPRYDPPPSYDDISFETVCTFNNLQLSGELGHGVVMTSPVTPPPSYTEEPPEVHSLDEEPRDRSQNTVSVNHTLSQGRPNHDNSLEYPENNAQQRAGGARRLRGNGRMPAYAGGDLAQTRRHIQLSRPICIVAPESQTTETNATDETNENADIPTTWSNHEQLTLECRDQPNGVENPTFEMDEGNSHVCRYSNESET